jgi:hypothetical protein
MLNAIYFDKVKYDAVIAGDLPDTTKVGTGRTEDGVFVSLFLSFDRNSGDLHTSQDGARVRINIRYSR